MNASLSPYSRQQLENKRLLDQTPALGEEVISHVPPFHYDLETTPELGAGDIALFEALGIEAARTAIRSVASLAQINEVDHMGGGLDLIPALLPTLALVDRQAKDFTIENAHTSAGYFAALATLGYLDVERFVHFFRRGLDVPGHVSWVPGGTQLNGGRLGVMIPAAVGAALGKRAASGDAAWMLCHCGDAGWISGQALNGFHVAKLHRAPISFIMHTNGVQLSGTTAHVTATDPRPIIRALGIEILEIPFLHDLPMLWRALGEARRLAKIGQPSLIYPIGRQGVPLTQLGEEMGILPELAAFAQAQNVTMDTRVWKPGCMMSYRDLPAMLECLFFVNNLPGGKPHHDGHMKGRDEAAVLANPMLQFSAVQKAALEQWQAQPKVEVTTRARPAPGAPNLSLCPVEMKAAAAVLPKPGFKWANVREGVSAGYGFVAESHPKATFILDCDIAPSTKLDKGMAAIDDHHRFQFSIEEQAAAMVANGIAVSTPEPKLVLFGTFAAFFEGIAREGFEMWRYQRNLTGVNEGVNVTFHLAHVGSCTGRDHFSGWALDWINLGIECLPYLDRFYAPCDPHAAFQAICDLASRNGAHIIAIPRDVLPVLAAAEDDSRPLFDACSAWQSTTALRRHDGARKAILAFGSTAFVAAEAADQMAQAGTPVDAWVINGLPLEPERLQAFFRDYPEGLVTIEDGLIGSPKTGLRGFASLVSGAAYGSGVPLQHLGITDPRVAPSEGHLQLWDYFGINVPTLLEALQSL